MRPFSFALILICCSLAFASRAQDTTTTNVLKTEIENFEAQTGTVIVKGFGQGGSLTTAAGIISVRLKESIDVGHGRRLYGVAIELAAAQRREIFVVDYDEMDALVTGIDYLGRITYDVTAMPSFEASFTTRSGVRLVSYSAVRQGGIHTYLLLGETPRISLASDQLAQFENLIAQSKSALDALKNK
jgi:hypothetical protein